MTQNPQLPQVDLPPISVGRYLDLVRRRRWQVIPVSLLGLLVGALVAFMIPRYYVASTTVVYRGAPTNSEVMTASDPMADIVAGAEIYIPEAIPKAIQQLGWEEGRGELPDVMAFESEVAGRLQVIEMQRKKGRTLVEIVIRYADEDGERSADLCNAVRDIWIKEERQRLRDQADEAHKLLTQALSTANKEASYAREDLADYEEQNNLNAVSMQIAPGVQESTVAKALAEAMARERVLEGQISIKELTLERYERKLMGILRRIPKLMEDQVDPAVLATLTGLKIQRQTIERSLLAITENNPMHSSYAAYLARLDAEIQQLLAEVGLTGGAETAPNPKWDELKEMMEQLENQLAVQRREREVVARQIVDLKKQREELPELVRGWDIKKDEVERTREQVLEVTRQMNEATSYLSPITTNPIDIVKEARVEPAPTEPNIYLVALAGSLVGLGAVVVLILLMDLLQSTFKTVGDVEHALALPVLGTMAHMESEEVRDEATKVRRRKTILASVAFLLVIAIIVVYYIDPTRLPEPVRHVLSLILDEPGR